MAKNRAPMSDLRGYLTPEQVEQMIQLAKSERDKLLIRMLWRTGLRISEILSLMPRSIIWQDSTIIVKRLKKKDPTENIVPVDRATLDGLWQYITESFTGKEDERIFNITRQRAWQIIQSLGKRSRIDEKNRHPHVLRHSFAVHWTKRGGELRRLQLALGHTDIATTSHYLQFSTQDLREEYDKVWGD